VAAVDNFKSASVECVSGLDAAILEAAAAALRADDHVVAYMLQRTWTNLQNRRAGRLAAACNRN
jgi:hypothetical protein